MSPQEYKKTTDTFAATIRHIISWTENQKHFEDMMIRILYEITMTDYNRQKQHNITLYGKKNWYLLDKFAIEYLEKYYNQLQKYNLLNNQLYQSIYKKEYCNTIKKEQTEQIKSKFYDTLLQKICV